MIATALGSASAGPRVTNLALDVLLVSPFELDRKNLSLRHEDSPPF